MAAICAVSRRPGLGCCTRTANACECEMPAVPVRMGCACTVTVSGSAWAPMQSACKSAARIRDPHDQRRMRLQRQEQAPRQRACNANAQVNGSALQRHATQYAKCRLVGSGRGTHAVNTCTFADVWRAARCAGLPGARGRPACRVELSPSVCPPHEAPLKLPAVCAGMHVNQWNAAACGCPHTIIHRARAPPN